ncbi:hypothetical protein BC828DRAFT_375922 [Blastocladiella britannica]|nr:hypothetical protein BC828DRAFT_375922 [Blastocladiella britannica]
MASINDPPYGHVASKAPPQRASHSSTVRKVIKATFRVQLTKETEMVDMLDGGPKRACKLYRWTVAFSCDGDVPLGNFVDCIEVRLHESFGDRAVQRLRKPFTMSMTAWGQFEFEALVHYKDEFHVPAELKGLALRFEPLNRYQPAQEFPLMIRGVTDDMRARYFTVRPTQGQVGGKAPPTTVAAIAGRAAANAAAGDRPSPIVSRKATASRSTIGSTTPLASSSSGAAATGRASSTTADSRRVAGTARPPPGSARPPVSGTAGRQQQQRPATSEAAAVGVGVSRRPGAVAAGSRPTSTSSAAAAAASGMPALTGGAIKRRLASASDPDALDSDGRNSPASSSSVATTAVKRQRLTSLTNTTTSRPASRLAASTTGDAKPKRGEQPQAVVVPDPFANIVLPTIERKSEFVSTTSSSSPRLGGSSRASVPAAGGTSVSRGGSSASSSRARSPVGYGSRSNGGPTTSAPSTRPPSAYSGSERRVPSSSPETRSSALRGTGGGRGMRSTTASISASPPLPLSQGNDGDGSGTAKRLHRLLSGLDPEQTLELIRMLYRRGIVGAAVPTDYFRIDEQSNSLVFETSLLPESATRAISEFLVASGRA